MVTDSIAVLLNRMSEAEYPNKSTLRLLFAFSMSMSDIEMFQQLWKSAGAEGSHSIMDAGEESFVHTHKIQIIVIRYVGLWAGPVHLLPE